MGGRPNLIFAHERSGDHSRGGSVRGKLHNTRAGARRGGRATSPRSRPLAEPLGGRASIVQVKRVRLPAGARPPGRGPPCTNKVGRGRRTSARRASPSPSRRQRAERPVPRWLRSRPPRRARPERDRRGGHGFDPYCPLNRERGVGEQATGVAPAASGVRPRTEEPQRVPRHDASQAPSSRPPSRARPHRTERDAVAGFPVDRRSDRAGRRLPVLARRSTRPRQEHIRVEIGRASRRTSRMSYVDRPDGPRRRPDRQW